MAPLKRLTRLDHIILRQERTCLPFLYQTATILHKSSPVQCNNSQKKCLHGSSSRAQYRPQGSSRLATLDREIQADISPSFHPNSTLSAAEEQTFRRIFEAAAQGLPPPSMQEQDEPSESNYVLGSSLDEVFAAHGAQSLFDMVSKDEESLSHDKTSAALRKQESGEELEGQTVKRVPVRRSAPVNFPEALRAAWRDVQRSIQHDGSADGKPKRKRKTSKPKTLVQKEVEELKVAEVRRVEGLLEHVHSDREVWQLLETDALAQIKVLISNIEDKKTTANARAAGAQLTPSQIAVIRSAYPIHLVNALQVLRTKFPRSPFATAILPAVKKLGPISHVLGSSTALYNELLYIAWRQNADIAECARLVQDMYSMGLHLDTFTTSVFFDAQREMQLSLKKDAGVSLTRSMWWRLKGVQSAMTSWRAGMDLLDARAEEEEKLQQEWEMEREEFENTAAQMAP